MLKWQRLLLRLPIKSVPKAHWGKAKAQLAKHNNWKEKKTTKVNHSLSLYINRLGPQEATIPGQHITLQNNTH